MNQIIAEGIKEFQNLQEAVDAIPENRSEKTIIRIKPGVYRQKVRITKPNISLIGESADNTILTFDDGAYKEFPDGSKYGTFNSFSVYVSGDDFTASGITFENAAGKGETAGQAIAVSVMGDRAAFYNCRFLGNQDTLFTGPLPPSPLQKDGFKGPDEKKPRKNTRQYYENCIIRGDIDFIFGSATAVFNKCKIIANENGKSTNGYLTAASTPEGKPYGYVFFDCELTSDAQKATYYLGRPWRDFAKTVFIRCKMDCHIKPEGFDDWNKEKAAANTVFYAEYGSYGPGAENYERPAWVKKLTDKQLEPYNIRNILGGSDDWQPHCIR